VPRRHAHRISERVTGDSSALDSSSDARARIGVACASDPTDPNAFSGSPAGLLAALSDCGCSPVAIPASLPRGIQRNLQLALAAATLRPVDLSRSDTSDQNLLRSAVRRRQSCLQASRSLAWIRSRAAQRSAHLHRPLDGAIQFGTDFRLPHDLPFITYDDQTVAQAARSYPYPWASNLSPRELDYVTRRQRSILQAARVCAAASEWAATSIVEDYGIDPQRVVVVGVGASHRAPPASKDWSTPRFLFVGKDWTRKNGDAVVRAFAELRQSHPQATLDLAGCDSDPKIDGVSSNGFLDPVSPAARERLQQLYSRATCFVMPSRHEPSAISYVEAASAGVGSIGTTSGGSSTLIGDGGVLVDPHDPSALLGAMRAFADPQTAERFGTIARERSDQFSWESVTRRLVGVLLEDDPVRYDLRSA
jgi:glycosyltransferase involved in cell wall biosynthesis